MIAIDILKFSTLIYFFAIGVWFARAHIHFNKESRAKPALFIILALSFVVSAATIAVALANFIPLVNIVTALLMATGSAFLFKSALQAINKKNLGLAFSGIVPDIVVQEGPYKYIRHPLYTSYCIFWLSCAVFSGSMIVGLLSATVIFMYVIAARAEEQDLLKAEISESYKLYCQKTGLIFPKLLLGRIKLR